MLDKVLSCQNLPTLPTVAMELLDRTSDPDVAMKDIARLVESDVGLASRILRTVNSSFYGLSQPCNSIDRALNYLGLKAVKSLVLGFSMVSVTRSVKSGRFDLHAYWRRTLFSATAARALAVATRACDADEALTAGLFQDMGMLAIFVAIPNQYVPVLESAPDYHSQLKDHEVKHLGFSHAEVGAALAEKWKLPDNTIQSIRFHHEPDSVDAQYLEIARTVALGRVAADALIAEHPAQAVAELIARAKEWFDCEKEEVEALLDRITSASGELASLLDQNIGALPDPQDILARANEQLIEHQMRVQREAAELERKAAELQSQTLTDALTGVANRKRFDARMAECFAGAGKSGKPLAVLFLDADKFKRVNDTYGHQAGDAVLVELAARLRRSVGEIGDVCRYGGEEFAVVLPKFNATKASRVADLVRQTIAATPFDLSQVEGAPDELPVTVSVGVSIFEPGSPGQVRSAGELVHQADQAVYEAKRAGRNCVKLYQSTSADTASGPASGNASLRVLIVHHDALTAGVIGQAFTAAGAPVATVVRGLVEAEQTLAGWRVQSPLATGLIIAEWHLSDGEASGLLASVGAWPNAAAWRLVALVDDAAQRRVAAGAWPSSQTLAVKDEIVADLTGWAKGIWAGVRRSAQPSKAA